MPQTSKLMPCSPHEADLQCDHCERSFDRLSLLTQHVITHVEEKPHQCLQCTNKWFARASDLSRHMRYCKGKNQEAPLPPLKTDGSASVVDTTFTHPDDIASESAYPSRRFHSPPPSAASPPNVRTTPVVATAFLSASKHEHVLKYLSGVHQPQQGSFEDHGMDPNALGSGSNYEQLRNAFTSATLNTR
ncbi:hypothetical protein DL93DRAFT_1401366 [Clavulina sp. PMI_390]|nr:hypothetical protein DL93DRAFT_1401366 [Clavulina sp. PMI_390]